MLAGVRNVGATVPSSLRRPALLQVRARTSTASMHKASNKIAKQLDATGNWQLRRGKKSPTNVTAREIRRVNVVSEELCKDIVKYIGPSLERHRGCDLIDLNPGAGVWSRELHNFLEPRRHIMMDADAELYNPFLADLLSKDNVKMVPQSGVTWKYLTSMLQTELPDLEDRSADEIPQRNDTLLVTANLSTYPKKSFRGFDNISSMVLYQFMSSIRMQSLFQRYGLVRMLIWVNDDLKRRVVPQSINRRRKSAFEAELSCDWVHEVAGFDAEFKDRTALRDQWIDRESACNVKKRMDAAGLTMPTGRETRMYAEIKANPGLADQKLAGERVPEFQRPFKQELAGLETPKKSKQPSDDAHRLALLRRRAKYMDAGYRLYLELLQEQGRVLRLADSSPEEFKVAEEAWNQRINALKKNPRNEFNLIKDSLHLFRQYTPVLLWDRREYEPLSVEADEFYPNAPTALIDIQPKAMHPLLRQHGPGSSHSGDMADLMLGYSMSNSVQTATQSMETLWAGFGELATQCPSLRDVKRGGSPISGHGEVTVRAMNEAQWVELMQAWMDWPFRPTYKQLMVRLMDDGEALDSEEEEHI